MLALLLAAELASPSPSPTPKTITTVKSSAMCDVLHESVVPAIAAMRLNDERFERGSTRMLDAAYDEYVESDLDFKAKVGLDMMRAEKEKDAIAQDVILIETLLADPRFDKTSNPQLEALRGRLEGALQTQKNALNVLSETIEDYNFTTLRDAADPMAGSVEHDPGQASSYSHEISYQPLVSAGYSQQDAGPMKTPTPDDIAFGSAMARLPEFAKNAYYGSERAIAGEQMSEQTHYRDAAPLILELNESCKS